MRPFISKKTYLVGAVEEQLIPTVTASAVSVPLYALSSPLSAGSGLTVDTTAVGGALTAAIYHTAAAGTGYAAGDLILVEGGLNGILKVATIGALGAVATLTVYQGGSGYTTGSAVATDPCPGFCLELPKYLTIQDGIYSEQIYITAISASAGVYSLTCTALANTYTAPYASIITPGIAITLQNKDFNCRIRNITGQPKVTFDGDNEQYATGTFRKDLSIATTQEGDISFDEKVAVSLSAGSGCELDITASSGAITAATPHAAAAGTGYAKGDWLNVVQVSANGGLVVVTAVTAVGGVSTVLIANAGHGYTTDATGAVTATANMVPTWNKFMRGMGHTVFLYTTKGVGLRSLKNADDVTMTLWLVHVQGGASPVGLAYKFSGCYGDGGVKAEMTQAYKLNGKFQGKFVGTEALTNAQITLLTAPDTNIPEKMLSNVAKTITGGYPTIASTGTTNTGTSLDLRVSSWELSFGNTISAVPKQSDSTGHDYYMRVDQSPKLTIDPLEKPTAEEDVNAAVQGQTTYDLLLQSALTSPRISLECPCAQLTAYPGMADKNGFIVQNRTYGLKGNNITTSDVSPAGSTPSNGVQPSIPDEAPYEILIGSRS